MANEAVILELSGKNPTRFTVAAGTSISKGTLLQVSADNTASASSGTGQVYAGVAAADKTSKDTSTTLAVHVPQSGNVFDMVCGEAITRGAWVALSNANLIRDAVTTEVEEGKAIGQILETGVLNTRARVQS